MVIQQPEGIRHPAFAFIASALTALCFVTYARADIEGFYLDVSPKRGPINESFALAVVVEGGAGRAQTSPLRRERFYRSIPWP